MSRNQSDLTRQITVAASAAIAIVGSAIGSGAFIGTPIAEASNGALSATSTLVAPAGPAFSIWSVIYIGLVAYTVWQFLPSQKTNERHRLLGYPIAVTMILNAAWILVVQAGVLWLSVVVIVLLLASLAYVFYLMRRIRSTGLVDAVVTDGTFGLYLGWLCVATIANITAWLVDLGITAAATGWSVIVLAVAALIGLFVAVVGRGRIAPMLSIVWGLGWLAQGRLSGELINTTTGWSAVIAAVVIAFGTVRARIVAPAEERSGAALRS
ncbi:tryptophan-rich sensory protein [Actinomycetes bacterium M1A6_2h]